ncbi:MAG TPA: T9SS type A sorting domain-containing protein [Segetibacter sp.]|jgi:hypothetical protein
MKVLFTIISQVVFFVSAIHAQFDADTSATIRFKTFTASKQMDDVKLNWAVACNAQYALFEILRSDDGANYTTINTFKAGQLRCAQPFDYTDKTAVGEVFYKIKTGDIDGKYSTEKIVSIKGRDINGNNIKVVSPALKNSLRCIISAAETGKANILISSTSGVLNKQVTVNFAKGINQVDIDVAELPRGIYMFTYVIKDEKKSVRFLKG